MLVLFLESRVVRGSRHEDCVLAALFELVADGLESVPVPLRVGIDYERDLVLVGLSACARAELDEKRSRTIDCGAQHTDKYREKHASRARVDVKINH